MIPTLEQLNRWLDAHNMEAIISSDQVGISLHGEGYISHHITVGRGVEQTDESLLALACNTMAVECLLPQPVSQE